MPMEAIINKKLQLIFLNNNAFNS